jgi:hypothetical protein
MKQFNASTGFSMVFRPNLSLIWMKSVFQNGKIGHQRVIVPESMSAQKIHQNIKRNIKHLPVVACISAAGESLTPYIVTSQDSLPVRENLKSEASISLLISF